MPEIVAKKQLIKTQSAQLSSKPQKSSSMLEMSLTHNHADSRGDAVSAGHPHPPEAALGDRPGYPPAS